MIQTESNILGDELPASAPLIITTREKQYLFYLCREKLLLQEKGNQGWEEPQLILPKADRFTGALDTAFNPHLVALDRDELYHLTCSADKQKPTEHLISREEDRTCSNLLLAGDIKGGLHLIYSATDRNTDRWWLLHHYFDGSRWLEPRVVDFGGAATAGPGCLSADQTGDLHLIYLIAEGEHTRLYYRRFILPSLTWDRAFPVSAYGHPGSPSLAIDRGQNLHLIWNSRQDRKYHLNYRKFSSGGWPSGGWKEIETISSPLEDPPYPLLYYRKGTITAGWFCKSREMLWLYKLGDKGWQEITGGQKIPDHRLICSCHPVEWEFPPATAWILGQGDLPDLELISATAPPEPGLDPLFKQLDTYSRGLIHQASRLTAAKGLLELKLEAKQKEISWRSEHSRRKIGTLTDSLQQKDRELQDLENKFKQTVDGLKGKTEQSRLQWSEEKKRYQQQISQLEKESRQLQQMLLEKESTIAKIETQVQELKQGITRLKEEKQALRDRLEQPLPRIKELLGSIFQYRP